MFNVKNTLAKMSIDKIKTDNDHIRLDADIDDLIDSMSEIGQINPVMVSQDDQLIAGGRRYCAAVFLEWQTLDVIKVDLNKLDEELLAIDENLIRKDLSSVDHDQALYRRKQIYLQKYPDTAQRVAGGRGSTNPAFTTDAAHKLDVSKRFVELAIARAEKATPLLNEFRHKNMVSNSTVDEIIKLKPETQDAVIGDLVGKKTKDIKIIVENIRNLGSIDATNSLENIEKRTEVDAVSNALKSFNRLVGKHIEALDRDNIITGDGELIKRAKEAAASLKELIVIYKKPQLRKSVSAPQASVN